MSIVPATTTVGGIEIDRVAILRSLKLDPRDPKTQALILLCERYGLDPLLKHMVLVDGNPYVTRDGYLQIAHNSGKFDGIEVVETAETAAHWTAKVAVWRKDMGRPVTYAGRYPKDGANKKFGPEMAIKTAEVAALRRAFNVTGIAAADEQWDVAVDSADRPSPSRPALDAGEPLASEEAISGLIERLNALPAGRAKFKAQFGHPQTLAASQLADAEVLVTYLEDEANPGRAFDEPAAAAVREPEPLAEPAEDKPKRAQRSLAQQLHIDAAMILKDTGHDPEDILDLLILSKTGGRSTSANDLTDTQFDEIHYDLEDVRDGRIDVDRLRTVTAAPA